MSSIHPDLQTITPTISLLPAVPPTSKSSSTPAYTLPHTIILATWFGAPCRAIARYLDGYQALFPSAQIYLLRTDAREFWMHSYDTIRRSFEPLVPLIQNIPEKDILLVGFSNGGVLKLTLLAETYLAATGSLLPTTALILDSAPGSATLSAGIQSIKTVLPGNLLAYYPSVALVYAGATGFLAWHLVSGRENALARGMRVLNDAKVMDVLAGRGYVFSKKDEMVLSPDVRAHAMAAERLGWRVALDEYKESAHVAHLMSDEKRYWGFVEKVWKESMERRQRVERGPRL